MTKFKLNRCSQKLTHYLVGMLTFAPLAFGVPTEQASETFDGTGFGFSTTPSSFNDSGGNLDVDYLGIIPNDSSRVADADVMPNGVFTNADGANIFAGTGTDAPESGVSMGTPSTILFNGVDISGLTDLSVRLYLASSDADGITLGFDEADFLELAISIDGGSFQTLARFESDLSLNGGIQSFLSEDTNNDGFGDAVNPNAATAINSSFKEFIYPIPSGTNAQIRITLLADAEREYMAIDHVRIFGEAVATNAPVLANVPPGTLMYNEGAPAIAIAPGITVSDADSSDLTGATVTITNGYVIGEDFLSATVVGSITTNFNAATGTLELSGIGTLAEYQSVLETVSYENINTVDPDAGTRGLSFQATDGVLFSNTPLRPLAVVNGIVTHTIPYCENFEVASGAGGPQDAYLVEGGFDGGIDEFFRHIPDIGLGMRFITPFTGYTGMGLWGSENIDNNGFGEGSTTICLDAAGVGNIEVDVLLGAATNGFDTGDFLVVEYSIDGGSYVPLIDFRSQAALNSPLAEDTNNDGVGDSTVLGAALTNFNLPILDTGNQLKVRVRASTSSAGEEVVWDDLCVTGTVASLPPILANVAPGPIVFTEGTAPLQITPTATITDGDDTNMESATVTIGNYANGEDVLTFAPTGAITGLFNTATGTLILGGTGTIAEYETALQSVQYQNTNISNPSTAQRTMTFRVNDGDSNSNRQSTLIDVIDGITPQLAPACESFETDGRGTRYIAQNFFDLGDNDVFERSQIPRPDGLVTNTNVDGMYAFGSEDNDADMRSPHFLEFNFDTSMILEPRLELKIAAATNQFESTDELRIEVSRDGGSFSTVLVFESEAPSSPNQSLARDINADGFGDVMTLTPAFQDFGIQLFDATNTRVRITFIGDGTSEEIAVDQVCLTGMPVPAPSVQLLKLADAAPEGTTNNVAYGSTVTYTYHVINTGNVPLEDIMVDDDILGNIVSGDGPLAPGETNTYTMVSGPLSNDVTNIGFVMATFEPEFTEQGPLMPSITVSNQNDAVTELLPWVDLLITKIDSIDPVIAGSGISNLTYVVTVTNAGPDDATGVVINEDITLPAGVTVESVTPSTGSFVVTATGGNWTIPSLPAGGSETLTVALTVAANASPLDTIENTARVSGADQTIINTDDDSATEITTIGGEVDLRITKTESADPVFAGSEPGNLVYVIAVTNGGPSDATGILINEDMTLPAGITVDSVLASAGIFTTTVAPDGIWSIPSLPVGAVETLTVTLTVGSGASGGTDIVGNVVSLSSVDQTRVATTQQLTLLADRDNVIYMNDPDDNSGALDFLFLREGNRGLFHFDLLSRVPQGATLNTVELGFPFRSGSSSMDANLHRLTADWGEGSGTTATTALIGESSWNSRMVPTSWSTPGGDFDPVPTATVLGKRAIGTLVFTNTPTLLAEVQDWVNTPASNMGWALLMTSSNPSAFHRYHSREATGFEPYLNVDFTAFGTVTVTQRTSVIVREVDLVVTQTESVDPVVIGSGPSNLVYTVTVTNAGPDDVEGAVIFEDLTLPPGVTVETIMPSAGTFTHTTAPDGNWVVNLAVGAIETLTIYLTVDGTTTPDFDIIESTATVTGTGRGEDLINTLDDTANERTSAFGAPNCVVNGPAGGLQSGTVTIDFTSTTPNESIGGFSGLEVDLEYSLDGGTNYLPATDGGFGSLFGNPANQIFPGNDTWEWNSSADIPGMATGVIFRIRLLDSTFGLASQCEVVLDIDNRPACVITTATGPVPTTNTPIDFTTTSRTGNPLDILLEYTLDGSTFFPMSDVGMGGVTNPDTNIPAGANNFSWQAPSDVTGAEPGVLIRLTTTDTGTGVSSTCELLFGLALDVPRADVRIEKTAATTAIAGDFIFYTLTVTNAGPAATTNAVVIDTLPSGLLFDAMSSSLELVEATAGTLTWTIGDLAEGATTNVTLVAVATNCCASTSFTNTASVSHGEFDPNLANNSTNVEVVLTAEMVPPVLSIPANTNGCNIGTNAAITGFATATDNCSSAVVSFSDVETFIGCTQVVMRTWTAMDDCGNSTSGIQVIENLIDLDPPVLVVPADTNGCNIATNIASTGMATATDACGGPVTITFVDLEDGDTCTQFIDREWTAVDACGNATSAFQRIEVTHDTVLPELIIPEDVNGCNIATNVAFDPQTPPFVLIPVGPGHAGRAAATDNCLGIVSVTYLDSVTMVGCTQVVTRTWTAVDSCNNSTSAVQTLTAVIDIDAPVLTIPADLNECNLSTNIADAGMATATDSCGRPTITFSDAVSMIGCTQTVIRTWTAVDGCNNSTSAVQILTSLIDTDAPVLTIPANLSDCNLSTNVVDTGMATATDGCAIPTVTFSDAVTMIGCTQTVARTWTAVDSCNNSTSAVQMLVSVIDIDAPVLTIPADLNECNLSTNIADAGMATATDSCGSPTITFSDAVSMIGCTQTVIRTWTAVDGCNNSTSGVQILTSVIDTDAPVLTIPADLSDCNLSTNIVDTGMATATDGCAIPTITFSDAVTMIGCTQTVARTWTAVDSCNNSTSAVQMLVSVIDIDAPVLTLPADLNECNLSTNIADAGMATATDSCGSPTITFSDAVNMIGCTQTVIRTWTAVDDCNNSTSGVQMLTSVIDTDAPVLTIPADLSDCNLSTNIVDAGMATATDGCAIPTITFSDTVTMIGCTQTVTRTWTAVDGCNNSTSAVQMLVSVIDIDAPVLTLPPDILACNIISTNISHTGVATASDGCGTREIDFMDRVIMAGCTQTVLRTWHAVDGCNNSTSAVQTIVNIIDLDPPVLSIPADRSGCHQSTNVVDTGIATAIDACSNPIITFSDAVVTVPGTQTVTRTWMATDECGNATSGDQVITTISVVDLAVTVTAAPDPVIIGDPLTLTITITNNGPCDASGVVLETQLAQELTFDSVSSSNCTLSAANLLTCPIGDLAFGASTSVIVRTTVDFVNVTSLTNEVRILGAQFEPIVINNQDMEPTEVIPLFKLVLIDDTNGYGHLTGATNGAYLVDSMFDLFPVAINGKYAFDRWTINGTDAGTDIPLHIQLTGDTTVQVYFASTFLDVTDETTSSLGNWRLDFNTGIMYADLTLCNRATNDVRLIEPFWYAFPRDPKQFLANPTGQTNGLDYVDITGLVNAALPGIGNNDTALDRGECVVISGIAFYRIDAVPFTGGLLARIFADPPGDGGADNYFADTDRDGMVNGWEKANNLNPNHASDAQSDPDSDGASNLDEFKADTLPNQHSSVLRISSLKHQLPGTRVEWSGGQSVTQYIEWAPTLDGPWIRVRTNRPPTAVNGVLDIEPLDTPNRVFRITVGESDE